MTAPDHIARYVSFSLQRRGRPHMTVYLILGVQQRLRLPPSFPGFKSAAGSGFQLRNELIVTDRPSDRFGFAQTVKGFGIISIS